jgi:EAL domain-containing protein (putative c-di-GMP-specific phosphodiesterase class I)
LEDEEVLQFITRRFDEAGLAPDKICFEVSETAAISNLSTAIRFFTTLSQLGCKFALDDFGSGYSSFTYLKNLPVDFLKIDGAFVKGIANDAVDLAMVKSIIDIGRAMKKRTIAECVDNDQVLEQLVGLGVDYVQGFTIAQPRPMKKTLANIYEPRQPTTGR